MKTALIFLALATCAHADAPSDSEVLEYVVALNRMHAEQDVDIFLKHVPEGGFWVKYPDSRREIRMSPAAVRGAAWRNKSGWPIIVAVQAIDRHEGHVDVTFAATRIALKDGKKVLRHGVFLDRLESSDGRAVVTYQKILEHRWRPIELGAEQVEEADDE